MNDFKDFFSKNIFEENHTRASPEFSTSDMTNLEETNFWHFSVHPLNLSTHAFNELVSHGDRNRINFPHMHASQHFIGISNAVISSRAILFILIP